MNVTRTEINRSLRATSVMAKEGVKDRDKAKKLARHIRWAEKKKREWDTLKRLLEDGHAKRDEKGNIIPMTALDPERQIAVPISGSAEVEDHMEYRKALEDLDNEEVSTSGTKFTEEDIIAFLGKSYPTEIIVDLGPFYDWGDEEEEEEG